MAFKFCNTFLSDFLFKVWLVFRFVIDMKSERTNALHYLLTKVPLRGEPPFVFVFFFFFFFSDSIDIHGLWGGKEVYIKQIPLKNVIKNPMKHQKCKPTFTISGTSSLEFLEKMTILSPYDFPPMCIYFSDSKIKSRIVSHNKTNENKVAIILF